MATRIVSWSGDEHIVSPNLSKTPSVISVDSILFDKPEASEPQLTHSTASKVVEPNGTRTSTLASTTIYPGTDGSFVRHNKYFFKDGNVSFLVDNVLYCVHRYFFSRDSAYFSTRFAQLHIRDHEAIPTIISLSDVERKHLDAFLSILYPENFEDIGLSYEEWKSVLHLSTHWGFASIRKLALSSIEPPTPHDRLLLARMYSVDHWVVPALSALCERATPLTLSEAQQMNIEDVVLVSTVREDIRGRTLQVDTVEIPLRVEAEQLGALGLEIPLHLRSPRVEASSPVDLKRATKDYRSDGECLGKEEFPGNVGVRKGELAQQTKNSQREVTGTRTVETGAKTWQMTNNIGLQQGDGDGLAITTSAPTLNAEHPVAPANEKFEIVPPVTVGSGPAASPALPSYPVGREISLPFGQLLPGCAKCNCSALIAKKHPSKPEKNCVLCLDHGLQGDSVTRDLILKQPRKWYGFISTEHKAAIQAVLS